uniref:Elongation of very long chain fatty acids protein n=1 Tax=Caenorhabditis tropicalis TaxID=1561998 RepID=A0A1I7V0C8_9PELO
MAKYDYNPKYGLENYSIFLPFETTFDARRSTSWMQNHWYQSVTASAIYVGVIFTGKKIMEKYKPFQLDTPLFVWNSFLAIFSILGFLRMTPEFIWSWSAEGNSFKYSICHSSYAQGVTGFWTEQFAMSKLFELIDTVFIVLRKRPLIFLHWYHHVTVMIYTWHAYKDHTASGRWFIWMNYGVHALMYSYYALRSLKFRLPKQMAMVVTTLQLAQMVMGVIIGVTVYRIKSSGEYCQQTWDNLGLCFGVYFTYFLLFANFFYHAYVKKNNRYTEVKKEKKQEETAPIEILEPKEDINANIAEPSVTTRSVAARRKVQKAD